MTSGLTRRAKEVLAQTAEFHETDVVRVRPSAFQYLVDSAHTDSVGALLQLNKQARWRVGKLVGNKRYLHVDALPEPADEPDAAALLASLAAVEEIARVRRGEHFNLVRVDASSNEIALLHYPAFWTDPFPSLAASWRVDLVAGDVGFRTYAGSLNPPILHRKELLLAADDPRRGPWAALTAACESVGLFDDPRRIGYRRQWEQLIRERGYRVVDHALVPIGNEEGTDTEADPEDAASAGPAGWSAARHRTALSRYGFSAPIQSLARNGLLDGTHSLFDYGCGRGDDLRGLRENGIEAQGWDPYFAPDEPVVAADIVNLGFVINVIEDLRRGPADPCQPWA